MKQRLDFPVGSAVRVMEPEYVECGDCRRDSKPYGAVGVIVRKGDGDLYIVRFDGGDEKSFRGLELERVDMW